MFPLECFDMAFFFEQVEARKLNESDAIIQQWVGLAGYNVNRMSSILQCAAEIANVNTLATAKGVAAIAKQTYFQPSRRRRTRHLFFRYRVRRYFIGAVQHTGWCVPDAKRGIVRFCGQNAKLSWSDKPDQTERQIGIL